MAFKRPKAHTGTNAGATPLPTASTCSTVAFLTSRPSCGLHSQVTQAEIPAPLELEPHTHLNLRFEFYGGPSGHELPEALARLIHDDSLRKSIAEHNREAVRSLSLREVVGSYLRSFALTVKLPAKEDHSPAEI